MSGSPAVELAEIDEVLQPLSHRRRIVHAAEHERIDRRRAWIEMAVTAREKGTNRTGPEGHAAPGPGPMVPLRGKFLKRRGRSILRLAGFPAIKAAGTAPRRGAQCSRTGRLRN